KAESEVFSLTQKHTSRAFTAVRDALAESFDRLDELHKQEGGIRGIPTGFKDIDDTLAGLQKSNLVILASRPGVGKTSLALNIAQNISLKFGRCVGFFSLEMSKEELVDRLLVAQADIDAWKLKTGKLSEEDFTKLSNAMGELAEAPIYIDDTPASTILEMRSKARRLQVEKGLDLLVVDYLQLARSRQLENRVQEVSEISQGLKNLARELKIPVLALSQLSRAVEQRGGQKRPQLADLRESGSIEQDADVVMFIWREDEENVENIVLDVAKHRNGPLRSIKLRFRGDRIKFYGVETKRGGE
ncbi:replicative DNA helicase, partial [Candidatus Woesebacteria bacterium RIFCSPHIGHO2_01_FULL_37_10]